MLMAMDHVANIRADYRRERGTTLVEVIVATMLLTVGVLAVFGSMDTASQVSAVAEHRGTAARVATSEIETMRSWPYDEVGIKPTSNGFTSRFESLPTVSGTRMRADASDPLLIDGLSYDISRHVTWSPISVGQSTIADGYKLITIIVDWVDTGGRHELRQDTGLYRPAGNG